MNFDDVFSFDNLYQSAKKCCNGVRWKTSTQNLENEVLKTTYTLYEQLQNGKYKSKGFKDFIINERGKKRVIQAVHITERIVQKCLCDNYLVPLFSKSFIYDNGACLKGKGIHFTISRINTHLHRYYKEHKNEGYVLVFDIKNFFNSIDHEVLIKIISKKIHDTRILNLYKYFINCFKGDKGLGLGSQISQISALIILNELDHYLKDILRIKYYGRYMDDGYILSNDKEQLKHYLKLIVAKLGELKLELNFKKTHIIKLKSGFTIIKRRYLLKDNGKIVKRPNKKNLLKYRRKVKKMLKMGKDVKIVVESMRNYLKEFNYKLEFNYGGI